MLNAENMARRFARDRRRSIERAASRGDFTALARYGVSAEPVGDDTTTLTVHGPFSSTHVTVGACGARRKLEQLTPDMPVRQLHAQWSDHTHRCAAHRRRLGRAAGRSGVCRHLDRKLPRYIDRMYAERELRQEQWESIMSIEHDEHEHDEEQDAADSGMCWLGRCDGSGWITWYEPHGERAGEPCDCGAADEEARELGWVFDGSSKTDTHGEVT